MRLEVGKIYLTRENRRVKIIGLVRGPEVFNFRGEFLDIVDEKNCFGWWSSEGKFSTNMGDSEDLVAVENDHENLPGPDPYRFQLVRDLIARSDFNHAVMNTPQYAANIVSAADAILEVMGRSK